MLFIFWIFMVRIILHTLLGAISIGASALAAAQPRPNLPLLDKAEKVRHLSTHEANKSYPVRLKGVVTSYDQKTYSLLVVQDETKGITVFASQLKPVLSIGDLVEIRGI